MRRTLWLGVAAACATAAAAGTAAAKDAVTRIVDGVLEYSAGHYWAGEPLRLGKDAYGYDYQAMSFDGTYAGTYLGAAGFPPVGAKQSLEDYEAANPAVKSTWFWPWADVQLSMKWNDAWLSNVDRDGDGKLDRHYGCSTYLDSGAWITNHMSWGTGRDRWTAFTKIAAAKSSWTLSAGDWYDADGALMGPAIWGEFVILQDVYNDGEWSTRFLAPVGPGLGNVK